MGVKICFIGVHGSGKTTTARFLAEKLGAEHVQVEAIDVAGDLDPYERQATFFRRYIHAYTKTLCNYSCSYKNINIVFDSHPVLVIPYTEWWLEDGDVLTTAMWASALALPRLDLLVYLEMDDIDVVIERIKQRNRLNWREEADEHYLLYIDSRLDRIYREQGKLIANHTLRLPASMEAEERAEKTLEYIKQHITPALTQTLRTKPMIIGATLNQNTP